MIPLVRAMNAGVAGALAAFAYWLGGGGAGVEPDKPKPPPPDGYYWHANYFPNKPPKETS